MRTGTEETREALEMDEVAAQYRAAGAETAPDAFDRVILRAAAREAGKPPGSERLVAWHRPLAFAATLLLCVALLLEVSEQQSPGLTGGVPVTPHANLNSGAMPAAEVGEELRSIKRVPTRSTMADSETEIAPSENAGSLKPGPEVVTTSKVSTRGEQTRTFRQAADIAAQQVQAVEASADATLKEMPGVEISTPPGIPATAVPAAIATPAELRCSAALRAQPDDWWQCIKKLADAGFLDEAKNELDSLRSAFPYFDTGQ